MGDPSLSRDSPSKTNKNQVIQSGERSCRCLDPNDQKAVTVRRLSVSGANFKSGDFMNKREMIHALVDRLLDIEESSKKGVSFGYDTRLDFDFHFNSRPGNFSDYIGHRVCCKFSGPLSDYESFDKAIAEIERIKNTPDVEPKITLTFSESEARERGLIA